MGSWRWNFETSEDIAFELSWESFKENSSSGIGDSNMRILLRAPESLMNILSMFIFKYLFRDIILKSFTHTFDVETQEGNQALDHN